MNLTLYLKLKDAPVFTICDEEAAARQRQHGATGRIRQHGRRQAPTPQA